VDDDSITSKKKKGILCKTVTEYCWWQRLNSLCLAFHSRLTKLGRYALKHLLSWFKSRNALKYFFTLFPKAKEAQDDLVKTKEELHLVMTAPPPPPPPVYEPVNYHVHDNLQDEGSEYSAYSAEFSSEGIRNDRNEEKRITEAEKNERVQMQLRVSQCLEEVE